MRGSISVVDGDKPPIAFEDRVELYRLADGSHRIVAHTAAGEQPLGVADVTVSRKKDAAPPIELRATTAGIEIHNHRNHNPVEVVSIVSGRTREIDAGAVTTIDRDTVLEIGHHTRVRVSLEPDRHEIANEGEPAIDEPYPHHAETAILDDIAAEPTVQANSAELARNAIDAGETLVADCLPGGPAATVLEKARTHFAGGGYEAAIERALQVRNLAENELTLLETVRDPAGTDATAMGKLRAKSRQQGLSEDVLAAYERLLDSQATGPLEGNRPPETVPTVSDLSLVYDDIDRGELLGTGGTAEVYEATVPTPEGEYTIALKEPRFEPGLEDAIAGFDREADTWERLDDHDNIVGVIDWGTRPHPWIAMEHMDRGPLTGVAGRLSPRRAIWTLLEIVQGVYHAHTRGVAHLDLKPGNVLLRSTGASTWPVPKVADWGLAKVLLEHTRRFEGYTPLYAAPEQVDPDRYGTTDPQTDIFQLGAIGYVLVTGRTPFTGGAAEVVHQILESDAVPPTTHAPGLPTELDRVIRTALEKDKADRYETIVYLRDDLKAILESL